MGDFVPGWKGWEDGPRSGFEPGCPSTPLRVRDKRMDQELGLNQDGKDERMDQDLDLNQDGKDERMDQDKWRNTVKKVSEMNACMCG